MTNRKLALIVLLLVLGVVLSVALYLRGERAAAEERAGAHTTPMPTSWTIPAVRRWAQAREALAQRAQGSAKPAGS